MYRRRRPCRLVAAAAFLLISSAVGAHELNRSESAITISGKTVRVRLTLSLLEVAGLDANRDARVTYDELDARLDQVFGAIRSHYELRAPGAPIRVVVEQHEITDDHVLRAELSYEFERRVARLDVRSTLHEVTSPAHQHLVRATIDDTLQQAVLTRDAPTATIVLSGVTIGRVLIVALAFVGIGCLVWFRGYAGRSASGGGT